MNGARLLMACGLLLGLAACQSPTNSGSTTASVASPSYVDANGMLPVAPSSAPHAISGVSGDYRHAGSGLVFPETSNGFRRIDLYAYNADDSDVSASYELESSRVRMTVFVFPVWAWSDQVHYVSEVPQVCDDMWGLMKRAAEYVLKDARLMRESLEPNPRFPDASTSGTAIYAASGTKTGVDRPLRSEMYASCGVRKLWIVQHRITYDPDIAADAVVRDFRAAVPLTP